MFSHYLLTLISQENTARVSQVSQAHKWLKKGLSKLGKSVQILFQIDLPVAKVQGKVDLALQLFPVPDLVHFVELHPWSDGVLYPVQSNPILFIKHF